MGSMQQILEALIQQFPSLQSSPVPALLAARPGAGIYISIGPIALQTYLAAKIRAPLLALYVPNEVYRSLVGVQVAEQWRVTTAIYAEPAPEHQMRLIRSVFRRRLTVGVLLTPNTLHIESLVRRAATNHDLDVLIQYADAGENVLRALGSMRAASVLLAIPDHSIYSVENLRLILESTYRRGQVIVGFSAALVRAGSLASAYSNVEDILIQAREVLGQLTVGHVPEPQYPTYWRVEVNEQVAHSLNVPIDEEVRKLGNPVR